MAENFIRVGRNFHLQAALTGGQGPVKNEALWMLRNSYFLG